MKKSLSALALGALMASSVGAETRTISLLHLNDLHAHLVPHKELVDDGQGGTRLETRGGLTRIATLVKEAREDNPNTLLMVVGDTFHGGAEAMFSLGNSIVDPVNALQPDIGVIGNWDYYFTPILTRLRFGRRESADIEINIPLMDNPFLVKQPDYPLLAANMKDVTDFFLRREDFMAPTMMMTRDGVNIGFIGLTSDIVENMHPFLAMGMDFAHGETEHVDIVNQYSQELREQGADLVVVMSELGIHKDKRIADKIDSNSVQVFFSAHTHEVVRDPVPSDSGAVLVEAGNDSYLGKMDFEFDVTEETVETGRRFRRTTETITTATLVDMDWTLLDVDDSVPADPDMQAIVDRERSLYFADRINLRAPPFMLEHLTQPLDTVIGHTDTFLTKKNSLESSFNSAWAEGVLDMTNADVSMVPGFRFDSPMTGSDDYYLYEDSAVGAGDITLEDMYRLFPVYYSVSTGTISGADFRNVVEAMLALSYSSEPFNHGGGWVHGMAGLDFDLDLTAGDGQRILSMRHSDSGEEVTDDETLTVAGCRRIPIDFPGILCGIKAFDNIRPWVTNPLNGLPWTAQTAFKNYLKDHRLDGSTTHLVDMSGTPVWPEVPFIQPLEGLGDVAFPPIDSDECGYFGKIRCGGGNFISDTDSSNFEMLDLGFDASRFYLGSPRDFLVR